MELASERKAEEARRRENLKLVNQHGYGGGKDQEESRRENVEQLLSMNQLGDVDVAIRMNLENQNDVSRKNDG